MTDALQFAFLLALLALWWMLLDRWEGAPTLTVWASWQFCRTAVWMLHREDVNTWLTLWFPILQLAVVAECIWRAGAVMLPGKRGGFYAWCWLVGLGAALLVLSKAPVPYPSLSARAYELHLGAHLAGFGALIASLVYTSVVRHSPDLTGIWLRAAWVVYLGASVAADRIHDRAQWTVATNAATVVQTAAVVGMIWAFRRKPVATNPPPACAAAPTPQTADLRHAQAPCAPETPPGA